MNFDEDQILWKALEDWEDLEESQKSIDQEESYVHFHDLHVSDSEDGSTTDTDSELPLQTGVKRGRPCGTTKPKKIFAADDCLKSVAIAPEEDVEKYTRIPLNQLRHHPCCSLLCLCDACGEEGFKIRQMFVEKTGTEQRNWVLTYLRTHSKKTGTNFDYKYIIGTADVCSRAWMKVIGISRSRFYRLKKQFEDGVEEVAPPGLGIRSLNMNSRSKETIAWLGSYVEKLADKMPDSKMRHLPSCLTKHDVYRMCADQLTSDGMEPCSESHFYKLWKEELSDVAIPPVNRFAKCDKCVKYKAKLTSLPHKDKKKRNKYKAKRDRHLKQQNAERLKYYKHGQKARQDPEKYLSLILDGMDQSKTYLPHLVETSKTVSVAWKLKMHLTGVIAHGLGVNAYLDHGEYPHDSNLTNTVLLQVISAIDPLPPVLYLQMDNCGRENKNRHVFSFLCLLVELKIFRKIKVCFLMVGHTHEDIDQYFSRLSIHLRSNCALTINELMTASKVCYTPNPSVEEIRRVYDFREWLFPVAEDISAHSKPHLFRITRNKEGRAVMHFKNWSTDIEWRRCSGSANGVLLNVLPNGIPKLVQVNYAKTDIPQLKVSVDKIADFLGKGKRTDGYKRFWSDWFRAVENDTFDEEEADLDWPLDKLVLEAELKKTARKNNERGASDDELSALSDSAMSDISADDKSIKSVVIGKKDKKGKKITANQPTPMQEGDMCLLETRMWAEFWPLVGQVVTIKDDDIHIKWWNGSMTGKNKPFYLQKKGQGKFVWEDDVKRSDIIHYGFQLTESFYLPQHVRRFLSTYKRKF